MTDWTYTSLQTKLASTLNKTNLTSVIPDFITLGESTLRRRIKVRQQARTYTDYTIDSAEIGMPSGVVEVLSFALTDPVRRIEYVTPDRFDTLDLGEGSPRFFTIVNNAFLFAPTPDQTYTATLRTRERLCQLSTSVRTNWLLCEHPDAYFYAALAESAPYLRDDERLPMWIARRDQIIAEINESQPRPAVRLRMDDMPRSAEHYDIERG